MAMSNVKMNDFCEEPVKYLYRGISLTY